jgi:ribosomal peptide maturation radical SAM protein 1
LSPRVDVLLCSMPFGILVTPSLALGLLQAAVADLPYRTRQRYYGLRFAQSIGFDDYQDIANRWGSGHEEIGEWVFAQALFPEHTLDERGYIEQILRAPPARDYPFLTGMPERVIAAALAARRAVEPFLASCLRDVAALRPRIVGFTSLFQQRLGSLALARRIKARWPDTFVVFGGADCEGVRAEEIARQFPFVDALVAGYADDVFPELVTRVMGGQGVAGLPGVLVAGSQALELLAAREARSLDALPLPTFDDYFRELRELDWAPPVPIYLSLETSRGCWWGQKHHCTFCSINGPTLQYRSKSAARVVAEVTEIAARHPGRRLVMTDSILSPRHLHDALPVLAQRGLGLSMQYETRANLGKRQLRLLRRAGVDTIQPGIESLSSDILGLMRKGTTVLTNLRLLKWARECGLAVFYNLLVGAPGEPPAAYGRMAELVPRILHLAPPKRLRWIEIGRHSPLFEQADAGGLIDLRPSPAYAYIYPFPAEQRVRLATYFTYRYRDGRNVAAYVMELGRAVEDWWRLHASSDLWLLSDRDRAIVWDTRPGATCRVTEVAGLEQRLLEACDDIRDEAHLLALAAPAETARPALAALVARGWLVADRGRYLSLVVAASDEHDRQRVRAAAELEQP